MKPQTTMAALLRQLAYLSAKLGWNIPASFDPVARQGSICKADAHGEDAHVHIHAADHADVRKMLESGGLEKAIQRAMKERQRMPSPPSQNWKGMNGAEAFQLIERHAEDWVQVREMMEAWLNANRDSTDNQKG
jgi:hypothetical protein